MNTYEMKSALQNRLKAMQACGGRTSAPQIKNEHTWAGPIATMVTGGICLGASAAIPAAAIHTLPILATVCAGGLAVGIGAGPLIGGIGITMFGGGIGIPAWLIPGVAGGAAAGSGVWLWELAHRTAAFCVTGLHWLGIVLLAVGVAWAASLALRYAILRLASQPTVCRS